MNKAVFLDRDGVINKKRDDYVKDISEFVFLPDVPKAIKLLNEKKFLIIIITNQSAINRGIITEEDLLRIHNFMKKELEKQGASIDAIYYCPHRPDENCPCRKPKTKLIERAIHNHLISPTSSWLVGDSESDITAACTMQIPSIRINMNGSLLEAVNRILKQL